VGFFSEKIDVKVAGSTTVPAVKAGGETVETPEKTHVALSKTAGTIIIASKKCC